MCLRTKAPHSQDENVFTTRGTIVCSVFIASCAQASVCMGETHLVHAYTRSSVLKATLSNNFKLLIL